MSMDELYRRADRLLYTAKERGRDQFAMLTALPSSFTVKARQIM